MNKISKRIGLIFSIIAALCVVHMITPTFRLQIPFNEWVWKNDPNDRIRYYMSNSLVEKLNKEKPDVLHTAEMLGQESMGGRHIESWDTHVTYFLMTPPFYLMGLAMYTLEIDFNEDGTFKSAEVVYSD